MERNRTPKDGHRPGRMHRSRRIHTFHVGGTASHGASGAHTPAQHSPSALRERFEAPASLERRGPAPREHAGDRERHGTARRMSDAPRTRGGRSSSLPRRAPKSPPPERGQANLPAPKDDKVPPIAEGVIRIIPLGGVEQIGRNMTAIEYGDDIIVVDAGIQFSTDDTPGVDFILPNTKYLEARKHKIRGLVITHGHLDHIGGIPYVIERLGNPPIYCREFGTYLIKKRHSEFPHLPAPDFRVVTKDEGSVPIGKHLKVRFFGLTHSIPDSTGVIIETPFGDIVTTGDVRVDNNNGVPTDKEVEQYSIFKDKNVLMLAMDSTGIEKAGWSLAEEKVIQTIDGIVQTTHGRIIIATFASQVERIINFLHIARKYNRKVVIEGRSMKNNIEILKHLDLADVKHVIPVEELENHPPHKIMILVTGAQGEEFAGLVRMANKTHKSVKLQKSDTVILSSSVIPGNEIAVTALKDNLYRHDARVITYLDTDVHTSGHGKRAELEWIHRQIPYKFFMPVHGHHFMLKMHAELALSIKAMPRDHIVVPDNGSVVEIYDKGTKIRVLKEKAPSAPMMVDGFAIGDIQEVVIRDRQMLAQEGMFVIIASINTATGKLKKSPDIISRGFIYLRESQDLLHQTRLIIKKTIEEATVGMNPINFDYVKSVVTDNVSRYLFQQTAKRPIVIPVLLGV